MSAAIRRLRRPWTVLSRAWGSFVPTAHNPMVDFLPRLKAGDSYSTSLMGHHGSVGSRFAGDRVAAGRSQPPSHIASTGV